MITATAAAMIVLPMYSIRTFSNLDPMPPPAPARALMMRTNTSIGAIAFRALTNSVPRRLTGSRPGTTRARTAPMISPASIRKTRLIEVHFS